MAFEFGKKPVLGAKSSVSRIFQPRPFPPNFQIRAKAVKLPLNSLSINGDRPAQRTGGGRAGELMPPARSAACWGGNRRRARRYWARKNREGAVGSTVKYSMRLVTVPLAPTCQLVPVRLVLTNN